MPLSSLDHAPVGCRGAGFVASRFGDAVAINPPFQAAIFSGGFPVPAMLRSTNDDNVSRRELLLKDCYWMIRVGRMEVHEDGMG